MPQFAIAYGRPLDRDTPLTRLEYPSLPRRADSTRPTPQRGPRTPGRDLLGAAEADEPLQPSAALLAELTAVHDRIDARIRCLARNRDALAAWLARASASR